MKYPFLPLKDVDGQSDLMPLLPLKLILNEQALQVHGLLDTAASVSVLPFSVGLALGAIWDEQTAQLELTGNLASFEARALLLTAQIESFPPVRLAFAWSRSDNVPMLLGQTNFFMEFDAYFSRSAMFFEVMPKGGR
jgi:hypothetical protein